MPVNRRRFVQGSTALGALTAADAVAQPAAIGRRPAPVHEEPYIDKDEWRDQPVRHRYVHGGFKTSDLRFSFYFPPKEQYQGRFFHPVMHVAGSENNALGRLAGLDGDAIPFAAASGGYLVESNMGSFGMAGGNLAQASAAAAEYSRVLAQEMYGGGRPYGYIFGGSGGGFKTIEGVEHMPDTWDGCVPFIHGSPISIPNVFSVQAHALRVLAGKFPQIVDAIDPGGSGDMYAGLNAEEAEALREVTRMGFPPRGWFAAERIAINYTGVLASIIYSVLGGDPGYFKDFWEKPGYLGFNPPDSLKQARIVADATITEVFTTAEARRINLPVTLAGATNEKLLSVVRFDRLPPGNLQGAYMKVTSGSGSGTRDLMITGVVGRNVLVGGQTMDHASIRPGDKVTIDNSIYLAAQTFHRHQMPPPEFYVWDQFKNPDGTPKFIQRPLLPSYRTEAARDRVQSGRFKAKMIVVETLMDEAAYPWQADWYRKKVMERQGPSYEDRYRLWFVDHAMHVNPGRYMTPVEGEPANTEASPVNARIVSYSGILQRALRDVALWAEQGIPPAASSAYEVKDGQVEVPPTAAQRRSVQPVAELRVRGGDRADIKAGETLTFDAVAEAPPGTGQIVAMEWDFDGQGSYPEKTPVEPAPRVSGQIRHTFARPGTYFPVVRVAAHKEGRQDEPFALAQNLARVRVVVT
jgi:hypothetical protein